MYAEPISNGYHWRSTGSARRLAHDRGAGVEHAGDDRRVDRRHEVLEYLRADHHRHASDADDVLDRHPATVEWTAAVASATLTTPRPRVERVLRCRRTPAAWCDVPLRGEQLVQAPIRVKCRVRPPLEEIELGCIEVEPVQSADRVDLRAISAPKTARLGHVLSPRLDQII